MDVSQDNIAYLYDGTTEGLLTAVFCAYANHEQPLDIAREADFQPRLLQGTRSIQTDLDLAMRVKAGLIRACGQQGFSTVLHASLSDSPNTGNAVYGFIRYAMSQRTGPRIVSELANPRVSPVLELERSVLNERHLMQQFIRFEHLENDAWFAKCNPKAAVVPLLMDWFSARFNTQAFAIYDEAHQMAGVYQGRDWYLVRVDSMRLPALAGEEAAMQNAWQRFYDTLSVEARYHPELRRQFMPKRLWKNITEVKREA